jgi:hypothetical protein
VVVVTALALPHVIDPVALKMISISFSEHPIAVALSLVPLALIDVLI